MYRQSPPPIPRETVTTHSREQEAELVLKRQQEMQERIRQIKESKANTTGGASATRARVAAAQSKAKPLAAEKTGYRFIVKGESVMIDDMKIWDIAR